MLRTSQMLYLAFAENSLTLSTADKTAAVGSLHIPLRKQNWK